MDRLLEISCIVAFRELLYSRDFERVQYRYPIEESMAIAIAQATREVKL